MESSRPGYSPINGKTYSLFGKSDSTSEYYETIRWLADEILVLNQDARELVENIKEFSLKRKILKKSLRNKDSANMMSVILNLIDPYLKKYTENTEEHLRRLPVSKFWDRRLATIREQYHLYMLEIELTNRLFANEFIKTDDSIITGTYSGQFGEAPVKGTMKGSKISNQQLELIGQLTLRKLYEFH